MKVLYIGYYKENSEWGKMATNFILSMQAAGIEAVHVFLPQHLVERIGFDDGFDFFVAHGHVIPVLVSIPLLADQSPKNCRRRARQASRSSRGPKYFTTSPAARVANSVALRSVSPSDNA